MIGIFDSGYGGLTIMQEIVKALPEYDYMYLGDNARYPYGGRSQRTVQTFTDEAIRYLFKNGCNLIIIACFTASARALREMQEKYLRNPESPYKNRKILGVLLPVAEKAAMYAKHKRIAVVATKGTVESRTIETEIKKLNPDIKVWQQACPLLVPLIEEGWHERPEARMILKKYLRSLKSKNPDALILGCTHYPYMLKDFKRIMGKNVKIINPPEAVAESLKDYLERHPEIEKQLGRAPHQNGVGRGGKQQFLTTDNAGDFKNFLESFVKETAAPIKQIKLT